MEILLTFTIGILVGVVACIAVECLGAYLGRRDAEREIAKQNEKKNKEK